MKRITKKKYKRNDFGMTYEQVLPVFNQVLDDICICLDCKREDILNPTRQRKYVYKRTLLIEKLYGIINNEYYLQEYTGKHRTTIRYTLQQAQIMRDINDREYLRLVRKYEVYNRERA